MRPYIAVLAALACLAWAAPASAELVYVKDAATDPTIFIAGDDGGDPQELVAGTQPQIAPDASTVAFTRTTGSRQSLWLVGRDGGSERRLTTSSSVESVTFSPDATLLAAEVGGRRLMIFEIATGRMATLVRGFVKGLSFAPDSQRIVFGLGEDATARGPSDVYVTPVVDTGEDPDRLTDDGRSLLPVWGPERIAFVKQKAASRGGEIPAYDIWSMTDAGRRARRVTVTRVPEGVSGLLPIEFSGDGRRLIAQYVGADVRVGFTVNPFRGGTRSLRRKIAFDLSTDGSAVLTQSDGTRPNVYAAPYDGGESTLLVRNASFPDWTR